MLFKIVVRFSSIQRKIGQCQCSVLLILQMKRFHLTFFLLVLLVLTEGESNTNVGNNTNIEPRDKRRVRYHETLNTLWTLQSFWGLLGTILNSLIVYALYTKRQAMATSVNMIIMSVIDF